MSKLAVVSATRKQKPDDDESDEDYSSPPVKIKRDAFSYVASGKPGGCSTCYFYDKPNKECELFEAIQKESPELFDLDKSVADHAGCKAHIDAKKK